MQLRDSYSSQAKQPVQPFVTGEIESPIGTDGYPYRSGPAVAVLGLETGDQIVDPHRLPIFEPNQYQLGTPPRCRVTLSAAAR